MTFSTKININIYIVHFTIYFLRYQDVPQVRITLGANIDKDEIREGTDVYFECIVGANPWVSEINCMFEGSPLFSDPSQGIIISNQSLVLQKVRRQSRGQYWCSAFNSQGQGDSEEFFLKVLCKLSFADRFK